VSVAPGARDRIIDFIQRINPNGYFTNQINNAANPRIHFETTGPEIWADTDGTIDTLVGRHGRHHFGRRRLPQGTQAPNS
jgi:cysteine synthase A